MSPIQPNGIELVRSYIGLQLRGREQLGHSPPQLHLVGLLHRR